MDRVTVVTSFSAEGYELYGRHMIDMFVKFWPAEVTLVVFYDGEPDFSFMHKPKVIEDSEDCKVTEVPISNVHCISTDHYPQFELFRRHHQHDLAAQGRVPRETWSDKQRREGYCYRDDALRFRFQAMVPELARYVAEPDILIWLDGDTRTYAPVTHELIQELIPTGFCCSYLGRTGPHSECGFMAWRLPEAMAMLEEYAYLHISGRIFELDQWNSAHSFDIARGIFLNDNPECKALDLTPGLKGHVWFDTKLGDVMDHMKGKRKNVGKSAEAKA